MTVLRTREEIVEYMRSVGHPDPDSIVCGMIILTEEEEAVYTGQSARMMVIDEIEAYRGKFVKDMTADPVEEPRIDPRRSRVTARGGRSDDWKGKRYGR